MGATFEASVTIERAPAEVFGIATDIERVPLWMTGVKRLEPLDEGPPRKGWRFKETRLMKGREMSAEIEVTEHHGPADGAPPFLHSARSAVMGVEGVYALRFEAEGETRTRVHLRADVRATSFLAKPLVGMVAKAMKDQDGDMLKALKALCESATEG